MIPDQTTQEALGSDLYALHCNMYNGLNSSEKMRELDSKIQQFLRRFNTLCPETGTKLLTEYRGLKITILIIETAAGIKQFCSKKPDYLPIIQKIRKFESAIHLNLSEGFPQAEKSFDRHNRFATCFENVIAGKATLYDLQKILKEGPVNIDACRVCISEAWSALNEDTFSSKTLIEYFFYNKHNYKDPSLLKFLLENGATIDQQRSKDIINDYHIGKKQIDLNDGKMLKLLIEQGFDLNLTDFTGKTLLEEAIRLANLQMIQSLILHGAKVTRNHVKSADELGIDPHIELALAKREKVVQGLIREEMANVPALEKLSRDVLGVVASLLDELPAKDLLKKPSQSSKPS